MRPVTVTIEEKIPEKQWEKFQEWALRTEEGDVAFDSPEKAKGFLSRRMKKKG